MYSMQSQAVLLHSTAQHGALCSRAERDVTTPLRICKCCTHPKLVGTLGRVGELITSISAKAAAKEGVAIEPVVSAESCVREVRP